MPGRTHWGNDEYRYSTNGTEKSPEVASGHNSTYFRELDSRTGRWWSTDPVTFPHQSPYCTFDNNPVVHADPSGAAVGTGGSTSGGQGSHGMSIAPSAMTGSIESVRGVIESITTAMVSGDPPRTTRVIVNSKYYSDLLWDKINDGTLNTPEEIKAEVERLINKGWHSAEDKAWAEKQGYSPEGGAPIMKSEEGDGGYIIHGNLIDDNGVKQGAYTIIIEGGDPNANGGVINHEYNYTADDFKEKKPVYGPEYYENLHKKYWYKFKASDPTPAEGYAMGKKVFIVITSVVTLGAALEVYAAGATLVTVTGLTGSIVNTGFAVESLAGSPIESSCAYIFGEAGRNVFNGTKTLSSFSTLGTGTYSFFTTSKAGIPIFVKGLGVLNSSRGSLENGTKAIGTPVQIEDLHFIWSSGSSGR